jgi:PiT family inorganic phosphate transporter
LLIVLLFVSALALAFVNGANDNFKATATVYRSGSLAYKPALRLATAAQVAGSIASVVFATALLRTFGGKGQVPDAVVGDPSFLVSVGTGAAITVFLATRVGLPISTTHALVGGLAGAGFAFTPSELSWTALGGTIFLPLLVSPLLAILLASTLYPLIHRVRLAVGVSAGSCVCLGESREPVQLADNGTMILKSTGLALTIDEVANCRELYQGITLGLSVQSIVDKLHHFSAFSLGFARGLNDTPKCMALLVAAGWSGLPPQASLAIIAGAMALGGVLHSKRVAETMAYRITPVGTGPGLLANSIASSLVIGASLIGSPVSTTHVSTGALIGIGIHHDQTDWKMVAGIAGAWLGTLPMAAAFAAAMAWFFLSLIRT